MRKVSRYLIAGLLLVSTSLLPLSSGSAAAACSPTISDSLGVRKLTFTNSTACTWTVPANVTLASTILIVGGGGGGGYYGNAGAGGAGAVVVATNFALTPGSTFDITAGTGGAGSTAGGGSSGTASSFGSVIATGGGGGAGGDEVNGAATRFNNGLTGGSGGGGSSYNSVPTSSGGGTNAATGISSPWSAFGNSGAGGSGGAGGGGGGAGAAASGGTGGAGKVYFGSTFAKGGSAGQGSNTPVTGSGNGGNVFSGGGTGSSGSITIQYTIPVPAFSYATSSPTTTTGVAFPANAITSTGTSIVSYSISPSLPAGVTFETTTGQLLGAPTVLLSSTVFTVTGTDSGGGTGTTSLTLSITAGPASISINNISNPIYKGVTVNVIATVNTAGKVRFFAGGKRISNCLAITTITSGTITATCPWKPAIQSSIKLTATITPTSSTYIAGTSPAATVLVLKRSTTR
jgi:Putative Ig domain